MATLEQLTQQVNALTKLVNDITTASKSINELDAQSPLVDTSEIAVSNATNPEKITVRQVIDQAVSEVTGIVPDDAAYRDAMVDVSNDYTASINEFVLVSTSSADITITLPTAAGVLGQQINVCKIDSNAFNVIVDTTNSELIIGSLTQTISKQWSNATFVSRGTYWVVK